MAPDNSLDRVLNDITTSNNITALNHSLRNGLPKESRDAILAGALTSGIDPLAVLDMRVHTLGVLYIMAARYSVSGAPPPPFHLVQEFCRSFIPEHARLAADRVSIVARGISRMANNPSSAIVPLRDLVMRYAPDSSYLTTIHPQFLLACLPHHPTAALPVLIQPITNVSLTLSPDLGYNDNLMYHYLGGIVFSLLKRWEEAEEFFELAVTAPATPSAGVSALQVEALKKMVLVQLISGGKTNPLPRYTHPVLTRILKNTPYTPFIRAYPHNMDMLQDVVEKEKAIFAADKNLGLINLALSRAPRWALKKLTRTYVTLGLGDIAKLLGIEGGEEEVRDLILSMIESREISALISASGTVTFSDPPPEFTKGEMDEVLRNVQEQGEMLGRLDGEWARGREFIAKALKSRDDTWSAGGGPADEEIFGTGGAGVWAEDAMFT